MIEDYVDERRPAWAGEDCAGCGVFDLFDGVRPTRSTCSRLRLSRAVLRGDQLWPGRGCPAARLFGS